MGHSRNRPLCVKNISPATKILQLETRPLLPSSRCTSPRLEGKSVVCVPSLLSDRKVPGKDSEIRAHKGSPNCPNVDVPTMVPNSPGDDNSQPKKNPNGKQNFNTPLRRGTPPSSEQHSESSSMEGFGGPRNSKELSKAASTLIRNSRAKGTRDRYSSAWKNFMGWCSEREVDPSSCTIETILNYLSSMFEKGLEYSTINGHRSAISAFHPMIEGKPIGQHPKVTALMKGISRERPQIPKYTHIWDVDIVLNHFREQTIRPENFNSKNDHFIRFSGPKARVRTSTFRQGIHGQNRNCFQIPGG